MAENLEGLIQKINEEGVRAAEDKAKEVEASARRRADEIIAKAGREAERLLNDARDKISREKESTEEALRQAGRDLILNLRKEMNAVLNRIITADVDKALSPEELVKILTALVKDYSAKGKDEVIITFKKEDLDRIEKSFLKGLKEEVRKGITLRQADDIRGGFRISYDSGKSYFDFSDKALAEYISFYLRPKLAQMLKEATL